jgi:hypothetical protein
LGSKSGSKLATPPMRLAMTFLARHDAKTLFLKGLHAALGEG